METYNPYMSLPGITTEELTILHQTTTGLSDSQKQSFYNVYIGKRKNPQEILIFALLGLFGIAGIHRIMMGEITMGILYLFTAGFFFVCTIMDLINYKSLTNDYNQKMAYESVNIIKLGV
ncbi:TM2 domain-containing protein [Mucilaginibacter terrigena]|uniref:TM2 domain-containing protein n=1 Tax=Mucilaginibacter terrigena TaxID=2492395 RepID=A0A4Q5LL23_9SPHI|nr:TM2 domain-containing protein [Mucilaginibacter terrigena]RYU89352.1 TM2 domain-containing protein [Mucilaginibacter terrigena]